MIASLLRTFIQHNPSVKFQLFRHAHFDLLFELEHGQIDFIFNIVYGTTDLSGFSCHHIARDRLCAVLPPGHPYAQLTSIHRYDLRGEPFFLTKFYDNPSAKAYGAAIPDNFANSGFIPKIVDRSPDAETLLLLVSCGLGITILPESIVQNFRSTTDLAFIPLEGEHEYVDVLAIWKERDNNPVINVFRDHVISSCSTLTQSL